jgi:hypothetical protein
MENIQSFTIHSLLEGMMMTWIPLPWVDELDGDNRFSKFSSGSYHEITKNNHGRIIIGYSYSDEKDFLKL